MCPAGETPLPRLQLGREGPLAIPEQACRFCGRKNWHIGARGTHMSMMKAEDSIRRHEEICVRAPHMIEAQKVLGNKLPQNTMELRTAIWALIKQQKIKPMDERPIPPELLAALTTVKQRALAAMPKQPSTQFFRVKEEAAKLNAEQDKLEAKLDGAEAQRQSEADPESLFAPDENEEEGIEVSMPDQKPGVQPPPHLQGRQMMPADGAVSIIQSPPVAQTSPLTSATPIPTPSPEMTYVPRALQPPAPLPSSFAPDLSAMSRLPQLPQVAPPMMVAPTVNTGFMHLFGQNTLSGASQAVSTLPPKDLIMRFMQAFESGLVQVAGNPDAGRVLQALHAISNDVNRLRNIVIGALSSPTPVIIPGISPFNDGQAFANPAWQQSPWNQPIQPAQPPQPSGGFQVYPAQYAPPQPKPSIADKFREIMEAKMEMEIWKMAFKDDPGVNPYKAADVPYDHRLAALGLQRAATAPIHDDIRIRELVSKIEALERQKEEDAKMQALLAPFREKLAAIEANAQKTGQSDVAQAMQSMREDFNRMIVSMNAQSQSREQLGLKDVLGIMQNADSRRAEAEQKADALKYQMLERMISSKDEILKLVANSGKGAGDLGEVGKLLGVMKELESFRNPNGQGEWKDAIKEAAPLLQPLMQGIGAHIAQPRPPPASAPAAQPPGSNATVPHAHHGHAHAHGVAPAGNAVATQQVRVEPVPCHGCGTVFGFPVGAQGSVVCPHCQTHFEPDGRVRLSPWAKELRSGVGIQDDATPAPQGTIERARSNGVVTEDVQQPHGSPVLPSVVARPSPQHLPSQSAPSPPATTDDVLDMGDDEVVM